MKIKTKDGTIEPDKIFVKWHRLKRLVMSIRVIPMDTGNKLNTLLVSPKIVIFKTNWEILPKTEGEIDEDSDWGLADELMRLPIAHFNFCANSGELVPLIDENPIEIAKRAFDVFCLWKTDEFYRAILAFSSSGELDQMDFMETTRLTIFGFNLITFSRSYRIKTPVD